jgi:hypothetical protein
MTFGGAKKLLIKTGIMKNTLMLLALCLSVILFASCQNGRSYGPGINYAAHVDTNIVTKSPITAPIHLAAGGYSRYEKIIGWEGQNNPVSITKNIFLPDNVLAQNGYAYEPAAANYYLPAFVNESPWWWNCFIGCILLGILGAIGVGLSRWSNSPFSAVIPAVGSGGVHHHYHCPMPVAIEFGSKEPSFNEDDVVKIMAQAQKSESGRFYYKHGHETLAFRTGKPIPVADAKPPVKNEGGTEEGKK